MSSDKVENIVPIVQKPLKPEDVIKPIEVLQVEPEDLKNLTSAPVVKEAIEDLYSTTSTVLATTTPFLSETTPADVQPSLKPIVIILPDNVTIDEIKTAIDLLPDTNNTVRASRTISPVHNFYPVSLSSGAWSPEYSDRHCWTDTID